MLSEKFKKALITRISKIPIVDTLKIDITVLDEGYCELKIPLKRGYEGVYNSFHGGLMMTAADTAACFAILTKSGADTDLTTTDMNIRFLYPCNTDLTARAKIIKYGRTLCPVSVDLYDDNNKIVAVAQVTYMILGRNDGEK